MTPALMLPARMDYGALDTLRAALLGRRGRDLALDASGVRHLGACGLELLVAARNTWERDGHRLTLMAPSPQMRADLETLGVTPGIFATDVSGTAGSDPVEPAP